MPPRHTNEIVLGKRAITADTDLRLARYFGMSEGFFLGPQTDCELLARGAARLVTSSRPFFFFFPPPPLFLKKKKTSRNHGGNTQTEQRPYVPIRPD